MNKWQDAFERGDDLAGNWHDRDSRWRPFWSDGGRPFDAEQWCWVEYENRDYYGSCDPLDESNKDFIYKHLKPYMADCSPKSVGPGPDVIDGSYLGPGSGYAIRVFYMPDGDEEEVGRELTPAFMEWCAIRRSLGDYPILDDGDYSNREYALWEKETADNVLRLANAEGWVQEDLPKGWGGLVVDWLQKNADELFNDGYRCDGTDFKSDDARGLVLDAIYALGLHARVCEDWGRMPRSVVKMLEWQAEDDERARRKEEAELAKRGAP